MGKRFQLVHRTTTVSRSHWFNDKWNYEAQYSADGHEDIVNELCTLMPVLFRSVTRFADRPVDFGTVPTRPKSWISLVESPKSLRDSTFLWTDAEDRASFEALLGEIPNLHRLVERLLGEPPSESSVDCVMDLECTPTNLFDLVTAEIPVPVSIVSVALTEIAMKRGTCNSSTYDPLDYTVYCCKAH